MPKKIQDITPGQEKPENTDPFKPEKIEEAPAQFEVEKKIEVERPAEAKPVEQLPAKPAEMAEVAPVTTAPAKPAAKNPALEKIEDVLEEDLEEIYFQLPPEKQAEFKQAGEETASKIELLLKATKVKIKKVLELIFNWLKIIPGINKFFLEQEAKIKTDKILEIKEKSQMPPDQDKNKI